MVRTLIIGLIVGALGTIALQRFTQSELNACNADRAELRETVNSF